MNYINWAIEQYYEYFSKSFILIYHYIPSKNELDNYINNL
jgi:hypothetical protein